MLIGAEGTRRNDVIRVVDKSCFETSRSEVMPNGNEVASESQCKVVQGRSRRVWRDEPRLGVVRRVRCDSVWLGSVRFGCQEVQLVTVLLSVP